MKKYSLTFLILWVLFSIIPLYTFFGRMYIWIAYSGLTSNERVNIYNSEILFNLFNNHYSRCLMPFIPGSIAVTFLLLHLLSSEDQGRKLHVVKIFFIVVTILSLVYALMDLLSVPNGY